VRPLVTYVPATGLAVAAAVAVILAVASHGHHQAGVAIPEWRPPPRPPLRPQTHVEAALAELVGTAPATLGPALAPLMTPRRIGVFDADQFDRLFALGERLHVQILDREDRVWIIFGDGEATPTAIDEILTKRWGAPTHDGECALWIDPVHQWQVSRCMSSELSNELTLEWLHYATPEQWVGAPGGPFGVEPFRLIGASRARIDRFLGSEAAKSSWWAYQVGTGVHQSSSVWWSGRERVEHWGTYIATDPAPIMRLLRAKYGKPVGEFGTCCAPDATGAIWGYARWQADGQRIEATFHDGMVELAVDDVAASPLARYPL
jgi:hypothetical protein